MNNNKELLDLLNVSDDSDKDKDYFPSEEEDNSSDDSAEGNNSIRLVAQNTDHEENVQGCLNKPFKPRKRQRRGSKSSGQKAP
ncbi:hypothetical protein J6590_087122 [Homalodisca vitripennis]|nr:hypothetical protein J6590_087122 [Homalodisca vitripennis]